ncbi:DNA topoisomerase IV subunit A [Periweissella ghanensis]|uniref:DNA topoisomerase 4 subunit A n=1 Tax=Periweissella ghanensis TaxID=467997 RepID=A0ABN8BP29_9LACO|nr:DNA topoisomerase IV subunit A [Periweissella ghanensis]MCM0601685.1 DNA topoisomerase IV subunit A [Periweissella ghanensis]CAH0418371.1 DNA topoisomerase 4 subunit A [Periweissella ghanensis]
MADNIQELALEDVIGDRFARYSKYIIQERALPDIRDGLKPVQRRILYAMNKDGNTFDKAYRKSAKSVGNVMGNYHPHGDSSIYEAMVRMSQDWKLREPLIEMHGNNGSIDADPAAAMRYTEARLSKIAGELLRDLDKETVEMVLNFDDTEYEPTVLPAHFPNLLVNGATGISAGYATDIPPHNLREVIDALVYLLAHPQATLDDMMEFVKGPDFPTGGIIQGIDGIKKAYETGKGRIVLRSRTKISTIRGGKQQIEVTEIPYEVNKAQLVKKMDEIRLNKDVAGISEVRDESDRQGLSIVIELNKDANADGILAYLFKKTDLQITYNFNMVAINNQRPERVGLLTALQAYLDFQKEIITKRTRFDLAKAQKRQHIVAGLIKMISILDEVVTAIRQSENRKNAKENIMTKFGFTDAQAEAIVTLQLYRLTNTDVTQLEAEASELAATIAEYELILADPKELNKVLRKELKAIAKEFGSDRKAEIEAQVEELKIDQTVMIADEDVMLLVSRSGYVKRSSIRSFNASDATENGLREDDQPIFLEKVNTLSHVFIFTNKGNLIYRPVHEISDVKWKDTGEHVSQTINGLDSDEEMLSVMIFDSLETVGNFILTTSDGWIKQTTFADLTPSRTYRKRAAVAMKLKDATAKIVSVNFVATGTTGVQVSLLSNVGYAVQYDLTEVSVTGARTAGVRAMDLRDNEIIASALIVKATDEIGIVTQRGAFKRMPVSDIAVTSRARRGSMILRELKAQPHEIVAACVIVDPLAPLEVITSRNLVHDIIPANYPVSSGYSNGTFVIDIDVEGQPIRMISKILAMVSN